MITIKKLSLYEKYKATEDAYIYEKGNIPNKDFDKDDWIIISELISNMILIKSHKASKELEIKLWEFIQKNSENKSVIDRLEKIAIMNLRKGPAHL